MSDHYDVFLACSKLINDKASEGIITVTTTGAKNLYVTSSTAGHYRGSMFIQNPTTHIVTIGLTSTLSTGVGYVLSSGASVELSFDPGHYKAVYAKYDESTAVDCKLYCRETRAWYSA
jgi:hypothetical protein